MIDRIVFLLLATIITSCIEFRISDEDAQEDLIESTASIQFGDLLVEDRNMHYAFVDQGKEDLVVFIHGSPGSWNAFIDYFKADSLLSSVDMISIDRPGFGLSGYGLAETSLEIQAHQIKQVTDLFPHKKKILVGHSLGGPIIARMAMDYPTAFSGLIMVAPSIDPDMEKEEWYRGAINTYVGGWVTPKEFEVSNDEILPLKEELEKMIPLWPRIQIPSIVIQGTDDGLVPKENADFAKRMMADSILEVWMLQEADHFLVWNKPKEIIKAIQELTAGLQ